MPFEHIVISSGHGKYVRGASGVLDEVDEARKVVEAVATDLRERDVEVKTFHDDTSHSQNENLNTIVNYHNKQTRQLDVSVHFNASEEHTGHGVEVLWVSQEALAAQVSKAIAAAGKLTDRGAKYRDGLAFLNNTEEPAILLEVCFCDNKPDCDKYRQHFAAICDAIADVLGGADAAVPAPEPPPVGEVAAATVDIQIAITGNVRVTVNGEPVS